MGEKPEDIRSIFFDAIEKETAEERAAFLDKACKDNVDLRRKVEALLAEHDEAKASDFLEGPPILIPPLGPDSQIEGPGTVIGRYKLLEEIGQGGMGVVYMAEQIEPEPQKVALKIIKLGMDTKQVIARFEVERQALALMDHPLIAKVLDAGATETGRPYFVMELVKGVPITEFCDKNELNTSQRLELFIQVCQAVQHAHQKGIIHRDIKPSNILVTLHDVKPVPKIIDFGIAKATNQRLTEKTLFTRFAQLIGTPEYMSPEQAQKSELDVDTRTDIYSLGVLLYELLTGTTPFDGKELRRAGYDEIQRIIREEEPVKPSTRLSTLGETLTHIARQRHTDPDMLQKLIQGDLDWVVMKSLEKDRTRRYATAVELAADLERHLKNEPVQAAAPSTAYKLRKFIRRNRVAVIVGLLVASAIIIGAALATLGFVQAKSQQKIAEAQRQLAENQQQRAEANFTLVLQALNDIIMEEGSKLEIGLTFKLLDELSNEFSQAPDCRDDLVNCYVVLATGQPENTDKSYQNVLKIIENLQDEITEGPDKRLLLALIHNDLGMVLKKAGRWEQAADHYDQANILSNDLIEGYDFKSSLAQNYYNISLLLCTPSSVEKLRQRGENCLIKALNIQKKLVDNFPETPKYRQDLIIYTDKANSWAWSRATLLDHSVQYPARGVLLAQEAARARPENGEIWSTLGVAYHRADHWIDAIDAASKSIELRGGSPYVDDFFVLALSFWHIGEKEQAQQWYDQYEEWVKKNQPNNSLVYQSKRLRAEAEVLLGITNLRIPGNAEEWYNRGLAYGKFSQWEQALTAFLNSTELDYNYSNQHPWRRRAEVQVILGDRQEYSRTCVRMLEYFGQTKSHITARNVALACSLTDDAVEDWTIPLALSELADEKYGDYLDTCGLWGMILYRAGRYLEAIEKLNEAVAIYDQIGFHALAQPYATFSCLAMAHYRLGDVAEARRWLEKAIEESEKELWQSRPWYNILTMKLFLQEAETLIISQGVEPDRPRPGGRERPVIDFNVRISTVGEYRLFVRGAGHDLGSDSFYAWIEQLGDGQGGEPIADWYLYSLGRSADFADHPWQGSGGFERFYQYAYGIPAVWSIANPQDYTIRIGMREDGVAIDALVFQLSSLDGPQGYDPEESEMTEEKVFLESDGRVVIEAENYFSREVYPNKSWLVVPQEDPGAVVRLNYRGAGYVQILPDDAVTPEQKMEYFAPAISHWTFDEGEGSIARDSIGENDGTLIGDPNGPIWTTGRISGALSFDGVDDYVEVPHNPDLDITDGFSVALWFKADPAQLSPDGSFAIIDKSHRSDDDPPYFSGWFLQGPIESGELYFGIGNGTSFPGVGTSVSVLDDKWHHVVGVFDGFNIVLYFDGVFQGSVPIDGAPVNNPDPLYIGRFRGGVRNFHGLIDEASIGVEDRMQIYPLEKRH